METSAQQWVESCGVCHVGGGSLEYDRDLNWYSADSGSGDAYLIKYATLANQNFVTVSAGYMSDVNKAEMDCLMCHLDGSNPGASWLRTLDCGVDNPVGPYYDATCAGTPTGRENPMGRTINQARETGVGDYDMFNRNFALKQYKPMFAPSMGAGATGIFTGTELTGVNWGTAGAVVLPGARITDTPKSENCSVCHARYDDTMGLPGMMAMKTGFGNFDLLYRPDTTSDVPAGLGGVDSDLDTDNGPGAANDDFFQDFGCKTGMGKRAHKINDEGDYVGANARYGMTPMLPSTMDMDPLTTPNVGDVIAGKMPDIDVHNSAGMQCATCHYALGSDQAKGYVDIPARNSHGSDYPAERVYGMDHQFAQADSFPDVKGKENLDNMMNCESCHMDRTHPNASGAPIPAHVGMPQVHLDRIGCATCHIPETYSAPGRLKYRDFSAGFWHHAQKNVLDWNYDLMTGSHNTVPSMHRWLNKSANIANEGAKIYPVLPSILPTWFQVVPNNNVVRSDKAIICVDAEGELIPGADLTGKDVDDACTGNLVTDDNLAAGTATGTVALSSDTDGPTGYAGKAFVVNSPVKTRDAAIVAEYVRDNGAWDLGAESGLGDGVCGPAMKCVGGVNAGEDCMDRTDCTKFDIRTNGANTFPLFDGFQLADGLEIDTKVEVDAMLAAFAAGVGDSDAKHTKYLALVHVDFDVTHGIVPKEWALGGSKRGGCVSCHSSKAPMIVDMDEGLPENFMMVPNPNYNANSVGFFEGYVQPVDKAGMMVGAYDVIKNWTAMFADLDCTALCGMGDPTKDDAYFFNPMTGQIQAGAECGAGSLFGPGATIEHCVGMMTSTFDKAMGFPAGTANMMGMYDGIAGLQGFTVNTLQTIGFLGCNPFGGPTSGNSPAGSVNACMPAPGLSPNFDGMMMMMGAMPTPDGLATCNATTHVCATGFRTGGGCANDADCRGAMTNTDEIAHNPFGLILSRKEVRSRQKIDLQQGFENNDISKANNIRWGMALTKNPGNPAHMNEWDQANFCIDRNSYLYPNPFAPGAISCRDIPYTADECTAAATAWGDFCDTFPAVTEAEIAAKAACVAKTPTYAPGFCSSPQSPDGQRHIMHMMTANQYLGYTDTKLAELMVPLAGHYRNAVHNQHINAPLSMSCSDCHYDGTSDSNLTADLLAGYGVATDTTKDAELQFAYTPRPGTNSGTCTTNCHDAALVGAAPQVAKARISAKSLLDANYKVELDGTPSSCYAVDLITGQVTQGTKTYAWTIAGDTTADTCTGNIAKCGVTWNGSGAKVTNNVTLTVTCDSGAGTSNESVVAVSAYDVGKGPNALPGLVADVDGQTVNIKPSSLDAKVGDVQIIWGDYTKSTITTSTTFDIDDFKADGIDHTYAKTYAGGKTYNVSVTTTNTTGNKNMYTYPLEVYIPAPAP